MNTSKQISSILALMTAAVLFGSLTVAVGSESEDNGYDEDLYGPEKAIVWNEPVPRVTFSHKVHTMDVGLECDSCHDDLFEMEAGLAQQNEDFTMEAFAEGKYCGACHDGDTAFAANEPGMCMSCHTPPGKIVFTKPVKAVVFDHPMHVDDFGFGCADCHTDLFKMEIGHAEQNQDAFVMEALYQGQYCGACHNGDDAFASDTRCTTCHIGVMGFERMFGNGNTKKPEGH